MYAKRENFFKTCTGSFNIAMGYRLSSQGLNAGRDKIFLFFSQLPDRLWDLSFQSNGYWG
jgi:hypothetical protein